LRAGVRLHQFQEPSRLSAVAKETPNICLTMGKQPLNYMDAEKTTRSGNQDFQARTSG
jgi:hypothetical protein